MYFIKKFKCAMVSAIFSILVEFISSNYFCCSILNNKDDVIKINPPSQIQI